MRTKRLEIAKPVKLTAAQHIALVSAANNGGRYRPCDAARETLHYLKLLEIRLLRTKAELDKEVADAWNEAAAALVARDIPRLYKAAGILENARYRATTETGYFLTDAARQYLTHGRVIVTVPDPVTATQHAKKAS